MKISGGIYRKPSPLIKTLKNISILHDRTNPIHNDIFKIFDYGNGYHIGVGYDKDGAINNIFDLEVEVDVQQLENNQSITEAYHYWGKGGDDTLMIIEPNTEIALCCDDTFNAMVTVEKEAVYCTSSHGYLIEDDTLLFIEEGDVYFKSVDRYLRYENDYSDLDEDARTRLKELVGNAKLIILIP